MYAVKASLVGQTFALATTNDSGGRKSRIRRSKEERKAMAESFIKRYEALFIVFNLNCLNLIHGCYFSLSLTSCLKLIDSHSHTLPNGN